LLTQRIILFFTRQGLEVDEGSHPLLIAHIKQYAKEVNQKIVTSRFMIQALASFFEMEPDSVSEMLNAQKKRPRRSSVDYTRIQLALQPSPRSLIRLLGSRETTKFVYLPTQPMSPDAKRKLSDIQVITDPKAIAIPLPEENGKQRALGVNGTPYKEAQRSSSGVLFKAAKMEEEVMYDREKLPSHDYLLKHYPELFNKPASFEFTVTKDEIMKRQGVKRGCSQNQLMGISAKDLMEILGIVISEKSYHAFHWGHRHGHSLGGMQMKDNLDAQTAACNYRTLFLIEDPLKHLLLSSSDYDTVKVKGDVTYQPDLPLPEEITYTLSWGNGRTLTTTVYPLSYARPSIQDNQVAKTVVEITRTPFKPTLFSAKPVEAANKESFIDNPWDFL
jgi:hypothetical protein